MAQVFGLITDVSGGALPSTSRPRMTFQVSDPRVTGGRIVVRQPVEATIKGQSFTVNLLPNAQIAPLLEGPITYVVTVEWFAPGEQEPHRTDAVPVHLRVTDAGGSWASVYEADVRYTHVITDEPDRPEYAPPGTLWIDPETFQVWKAE